MAVVDDLGRPGTDAPSEDYGRQPPQDLAAEQSVLGGMLLSKDAIADVSKSCGPVTSIAAHQNIYDAILEPVRARGAPTRDGGANGPPRAAAPDRRGAYVHNLDLMVPTAANAGLLRGDRRGEGLLRRLVEAGTRVVQYGYAGARGRCR